MLSLGFIIIRLVIGLSFVGHGAQKLLVKKILSSKQNNYMSFLLLHPMNMGLIEST